MKWEDSDIQAIISYYKEGISAEEISKILNRTTASIRNKAWRLKITDTSDNWTPEEIDILRLEYKSYNLRELSDKIGKNKTNVCRKAKEIGLDRTKRKKEVRKSHSCYIKGLFLDKNGNSLPEEEKTKIRSELMKKHYKDHPEAREATGKRARKYIKEFGHPRGMLGKHQSKEVRDAMSKRVKEMWEDPSSPFNTTEFREKASDRMVNDRKQNPEKYRKAYSRGHQGKRGDLGGLYVRSSWEANYARYLNTLVKSGEIYKWEYEPDTFWFLTIKRGVRSYLPDFKIWRCENSTPYYVEVKGWMDDKSKTKLKRMAKYYPDIKIVLFQNAEYKELKKISDKIPMWE